MVMMIQMKIIMGVVAQETTCTRDITAPHLGRVTASDSMEHVATTQEWNPLTCLDLLDHNDSLWRDTKFLVSTMASLEVEKLLSTTLLTFCVDCGC